MFSWLHYVYLVASTFCMKVYKEKIEFNFWKPFELDLPFNKK